MIEFNSVADKQGDGAGEKTIGRRWPLPRSRQTGAGLGAPSYHLERLLRTTCVTRYDLCLTEAQSPGYMYMYM